MEKLEKIQFFAKLFQNKKPGRKHHCKWALYDHSKGRSLPNFNTENVRLVVIQHNQNTLNNSEGRVLFDSKSELRPPTNTQDGKKKGLFRSNHCCNSSRNQPGQDTTPGRRPRLASDLKVLEEIMFGSAPMVQKGCSLKVHTIKSPPQVMVTKVFLPTPSSKESSMEQESFDLYSIQSINTDSSPKLIVGSDRSIPESIAQSVPVDVPTKHHNEDNEDSGLSASMASSYSSSLTTSGYSPGSSTASMSSVNSLTRRLLRSQQTSFEYSFAKRSPDDNGDPLPASQRPPCLGIGITFNLPQEDPETFRLFESFFFSHITLIESHVVKLKHAVEKALQKHNKHMVTEALEVFRNAVFDLYTAPRLSSPVWLNMMCLPSHRLSLYQNFLKEFMVVMDKYDTKNTKFFVSTMVTAVLTHHLAWVPTVSPAGATPSRTYLDKHSAKWLDALAKSHPYNPLWAQLGDMYGAIGSPLRLSRTVILGQKAELVCKLLHILSYFIRCSDVHERVEDRQSLDTIEGHIDIPGMITIEEDDISEGGDNASCERRYGSANYGSATSHGTVRHVCMHTSTETVLSAKSDGTVIDRYMEMRRSIEGEDVLSASNPMAVQERSPEEEDVCMCDMDIQNSGAEFCQKCREQQNEMDRYDPDKLRYSQSIFYCCVDNVLGTQDGVCNFDLENDIFDLENDNVVTSNCDNDDNELDEKTEEVEDIIEAASSKPLLLFRMLSKEPFQYDEGICDTSFCDEKDLGKNDITPENILATSSLYSSSLNKIGHVSLDKSSPDELFTALHDSSEIVSASTPEPLSNPLKNCTSVLPQLDNKTFQNSNSSNHAFATENEHTILRNYRAKCSVSQVGDIENRVKVMRIRHVGRSAAHEQVEQVGIHEHTQIDSKILPATDLSGYSQIKEKIGIVHDLDSTDEDDSSDSSSSSGSVQEILSGVSTPGKCVPQIVSDPKPQSSECSRASGTSPSTNVTRVGQLSSADSQFSFESPQVPASTTLRSSDYGPASSSTVYELSESPALVRQSGLYPSLSSTLEQVNSASVDIDLTRGSTQPLYGGQNKPTANHQINSSENHVCSTKQQMTKSNFHATNNQESSFYSSKRQGSTSPNLYPTVCSDEAVVQTSPMLAPDPGGLELVEADLGTLYPLVLDNTVISPRIKTRTSQTTPDVPVMDDANNIYSSRRQPHNSHREIDVQNPDVLSTGSQVNEHGKSGDICIESHENFSKLSDPSSSGTLNNSESTVNYFEDAPHTHMSTIPEVEQEVLSANQGEFILDKETIEANSTVSVVQVSNQSEPVMESRLPRDNQSPVHMKVNDWLRSHSESSSSASDEEEIIIENTETPEAERPQTSSSEVLVANTPLGKLSQRALMDRQDSTFDEYFIDDSINLPDPNHLVNSELEQPSSACRICQRSCSLDSNNSVFLSEQQLSETPKISGCSHKNRRYFSEVNSPVLDMMDGYFTEDADIVTLPEGPTKDQFTSTLSLMQQRHHLEDDVTMDDVLDGMIDNRSRSNSGGSGTRLKSLSRQQSNVSANSTHSTVSNSTPARCRTVTPSELGRRRHVSSTSTVSWELDAQEPKTNMKDIRMPRSVSETSEDNLTSFECNFGHSLLAGYTDHYMSDFVLHGTSDSSASVLTKLHADLSISAQNSVLDEPIAEACCVVADTDKWNVRLHTCQSTSPDRMRQVDLSASQMICSILESVHKLCKLKMSPEFCLMHLEDRLQEVYFKSKMLSEYVRMHRKIHLKELHTTLGFDVSDMPLLLAVAGTHTPLLAHSLLD